MKIQRIVLVAVVIAIAGIVQAKTIKEIEKDLKEKKNEWTKMQKENPGCVLEDNSKQQQAIVKRAGVKGHRNYFGSKQTSYVRDSYYCTFCKRDWAFRDYTSENGIEGRALGPCCKKGANAYNVWLYQRKNVAVTEEMNKKIDVIMKEIADLEQELKEEVKRQKEEQQKKNLEQAEMKRQMMEAAKEDGKESKKKVAKKVIQVKDKQKK